MSKRLKVRKSRRTVQRQVEAYRKDYIPEELDEEEEDSTSPTLDLPAILKRKRKLEKREQEKHELELR